MIRNGDFDGQGQQWLYGNIFALGPLRVGEWYARNGTELRTIVLMPPVAEKLLVQAGFAPLPVAEVHLFFKVQNLFEIAGCPAPLT